MNFDFSEEQKLLQSTARQFLVDQAPLAVARRILESDEPFDRELWTEMATMGWQGSAIPEEYGGAGFGYLELALLAEELGRSLAPTPFSSSVYLASEALLRAGTEAQKQRHLPGLASGETIGTLALFETPGNPDVEAVETTLKDGRLSGRKVAVPDGDVADLAVVSAHTPDGSLSLALVDLTAAGVRRPSIQSLDPSRSQAVLEFDQVDAEPLGAGESGRKLTEELLDRAAILVAFEQLGGAQRCLEMAQEHAMNRYAFGRPIASFQALKHHLADMFVAVELARSNCYYGAWALSSDDAELPVAACVARIAATDAYEHCARENLQIYGGVGFTWEYDCHLFLRRSKLLAVGLGSAGLWKRRLIARLRSRRAA